MTEKNKKTLAIDIGGTGLKMLILDHKGVAISDRNRILTPRPATSTAIIEALRVMLPEQPHFDRISVGFPGVVKNNVIFDAPNLDGEWDQIPLAEILQKITGKQARVANDADVQGLGVIEGNGVEFVCTLGTGFGTALFINGKLIPNLEFGHHPFTKKTETYENLLGKDGFKRLGKKKWNLILLEALAQIQHTFNPTMIYVGGGRTKKIIVSLPNYVKIVPNLAGLLGGIRLWDPIEN